MDDIVPELLEQIQEEFKALYRSNPRARQLWLRLAQGHGQYEDANKLSVLIGEMLSSSLNKYISKDILPEGKMWYNIALRILEPTLRTNYDMMTQICEMAQNNINESMGVGLSAVTPAFDTDRVQGLINKLSDADNFDDVSWVLDEPIVNFTQAIVDDSIRDNASFHAGAGLNPVIRRTAEPPATRTVQHGKKSIKYQVPCKWCASLAGAWDYKTMPADVRANIFRKHEGCRCVVEYIEGGRVQNVHTKEWIETETNDAKKERIKNLS